MGSHRKRVGGATAGGREVREEARRRAGGQKSLETRDKLGALSSVFPLGKSLSLDTSPSGDLWALVSGISGESLFTLLVLVGNGPLYFYHTPRLSLSSPNPHLGHIGQDDRLELNKSHS